jgi:hypothetical protein
MRVGIDEIQKSIGAIFLGLIIFFLIFFFALRLCSRPYQKYVVYVQARDETIFKKHLSGSDPRLVGYGRILKDEIVEKDNDIDNGDGPNSGKLRWYICGGIDCDEGWESRFLQKN